jgi:predicted regulator of Ras-like GTPase activity (Roadblock/LC7/MglB family)
VSDAVHSLSEALARDPASLAFLPLGEMLRRESRLEQARRIVMRGLERHPHLADAHDLLARIYADEGLAEKAFDEWDMVRRLAPGHTGAAKGMGFICFSEGRLAEAEGYLREAQAGAPGDESIARALAMVQQAFAEAPAQALPDTAEVAAPVAEANVAAPAVVADTPAPPAPPASPSVAGATDPRLLFTSVLTDDDQTAMLLDRDGFVLAGAYHTWEGRDIAQDVGAELSGVSDEATRATRHLGIGAWRSITFEADAAMVAMAPTADDGLLVLAAGRETPLGLTRRLLDRCSAHARAWLEGGA